MADCFLSPEVEILLQKQPKVLKENKQTNGSL